VSLVALLASSIARGRGSVAIAAAIGLASAGLGDFAATAAANTGAPRVIGGTPSPVEAAPWSVYLALANPKASCGGAVLDAIHVLTAAHCAVPDGTSRIRQPAEIDVLAGASDVHTWVPGQPPPAGAQPRAVARVSVHPYYDAPSKSDDIAVLTLAQPLSLATPQVKPLALAPVGAGLAPGTVVRTIGYGQQRVAQPPDGRLYAAVLTVTGDDSCSSLIGRNSAVMTCASSPVGTPCHGDSGSALAAGTPLVEIGLFSGMVDPCGTSPAVFTDVTAPEVRAFVDGAPTIPIAPRQLAPAVLNGLRVPVDGSRLTCNPGTWSGAPSLTYVFMTNTASPQILQSGDFNAYTLTRSAIGQPVVCAVLATNAGGTTTERSGTTPPVAADTVAPVARIASRRCVRRRCRLAIEARDPNSDGPLAVSANVSYRVRARCRTSHRHRCTKTLSRPLTVSAIGGIRFLAVSRDLPYTRVRFTVRVVDAAGNQRVRRGVAAKTIRRGHDRRRR
jgi:hypothetical protein